MATLIPEPARFLPAVDAEGAGPVRLCPWLENPYRLVSLWDVMVSVSSLMIYWSGFALENLKADCLLNTGIGDLPQPPAFFNGPLVTATREKAIEWLGYVRDQCGTIGLTVSSETILEIVDSLRDSSKRLSSQWLRDQVANLQGLIKKELKYKTFLYITPEKLRFCPTQKVPHIFGEAVTTAFPSAVFDIEEAGKCLSLARSTASVFHLMRALEFGLGTLGNVFGVSLARTNWAPALDQIESKIRDMHKDPAWKAMPDCKEQQEFYAQAASHFGILKDAWRNYTAHARGIYTEEKAILIFDNVREFMQTLATRLHE